MSNEDAHDVTKALAAFGAPSIRYHSFGPPQIKPSSVVMPPPAPVPEPPLLRQAEPEAAAEPSPQPAPVPPDLLPMPPVPAFGRTIAPAAMQPRPVPSPPPRKLSDRPLGPQAPGATYPPGPTAKPIAPPDFTPPRPPAPSSAPPARLGPPVAAGPASDTGRAAKAAASPVGGVSLPAPTLVAAKPDPSTAVEHPAAPVLPAAAKPLSLTEIFALLASGGPAVGTAPRS